MSEQVETVTPSEVELAICPIHGVRGQASDHPFRDQPGRKNECNKGEHLAVTPGDRTTHGCQEELRFVRYVPIPSEGIHLVGLTEEEILGTLVSLDQLGDGATFAAADVREKLRGIVTDSPTRLMRTIDRTALEEGGRDA